MAIQLKEISIVNSTDAYSDEFFAAVAKSKEGKFFEFQKSLPETTIRSRAALAAKDLKVKFSVITVTKSTATVQGVYAVGVTSKVRKEREKKAVPTSTESQPVPVPVIEPTTADTDVRVEEILATEGAV